LRACFFFFGPVTAILIAVHFPLLRAVWEAGRFTTEDARAISLPFIGFTVGLIGFACEMMLNQTFYAMTRAWTPTLIGLGTSVVWIIVATVGVNAGIGAGLGLFAIAASESFSKSLKCVVMWIMLRPHLGDTKAREMLKFLFQVLVASLAAAGAAWFLSTILAPPSVKSKMRLLISVVASGGIGMVLFMALASAMKMREAQQVLAFGKKLKRRKK
jgi:peptidoglycan biosynthesis protein MviN/MurJ (putative lipid II flippase)